MGYKKAAIAGFGWNSLFKLSATMLTALKLIITGRLLTPTEFGLFSLTAIALGVTEAVTETGVNITLIQSRKSIGYYVDTAWIISIIRGLAIAIIMVLLGLGMQQYYHQNDLPLLVGIAAFIPIIKGFINPAQIILQKELRFFADSSYRLSIAAVETASTIALVIIWPSVSVLLIAMIISALYEVGLSFVLFSVRPTFSYYHSRAKDIFQQARWLNLSALLGYLNENMDNVIIGKITSPTALGFYHNAYQLGHKVNYELAKSVHHSTLPVYSKISTQASRLKQAALKTNIISLVAFLILSLPLLVWPEFITFLLGNQWAAAVELVRPLTIAGLLQSVSLQAYTVWYATKQYQLVNLHLLLTTATMIVLLLILASTGGVVMAAWVIAISRILGLPVVGYGYVKLCRTTTT